MFTRNQRGLRDSIRIGRQMLVSEKFLQLDYDWLWLEFPCLPKTVNTVDTYLDSGGKHGEMRLQFELSILKMSLRKEWESLTHNKYFRFSYFVLMICFC